MRSKAGNAFQKGLGVLLTLCLAFQFPFAARATSVSDVTVETASYTTASAPVDGMVRVYLSSLGSPTALTLTIAGSYTLSTGASLTSGETLTVGFTSSTGAITLTRSGVKTNMGTTFSILRHSAGGTNGIKISQARKPDNPYPGDVTFRAVYQSGGYYKLYTIVNVYIENYLYGVLPYEMGGSAPAESLKAQAVAARTYTVRMMNSRASGYYDVVDTTGDQTYNGTPSGYAACTAAVYATKGIVLKNSGSYTATYYSSSNGGQTESIYNIWGSAGYGYLNVHDDPFDYANPDSTVKKTTVYADCTGSYNNSSLMSLLKTKAVAALASAGYAATSANTSLATIKSIVAHTPMYASPSRLYTKLDFTLTASTVNSAGSAVTATATVTCGIFTELESLLSMGIQSGNNELWTVTKGTSTFTLEARRYGHGLGMSQRGAMYMGKLGYTYDDILGFYYPGCTRVGTTFTNTILAADSTEEVTTEESSVDVTDGDEDSDACTAVVKLVSTGGTLAIRAGKSTSGSILGVIANSSRVTVYESDGTWCLVKFGAIVGYVPLNALTVTGTPSESSDESVTTIAGFATVTASTYLNLRESGSYSADIVSTAPSGAVMTVFSKTSSWAYVQYGATVAYACADYLSYSDTYSGTVASSGASTATVTTDDGAGTSLRATASTAGTVIASLAEGTAVTVTADDGSWATVTYNGATGYVLSDCLALGDDTDVADGSASAVTGVTATVTTESGSLNMRSAASAGSTILTTIPRGATVTVTSQGDTWCGVTYNGYGGYVMTMYLTIEATDDGTDDDADTGEDTTATTATVTTESGSLNLRQLAKTGSTILTTIPRLATVTVLTYGAEWCYVTYGTTTGYVMTVFLTLTETTQGDSTDDTADDGTTDEEATDGDATDGDATDGDTADDGATEDDTDTETTAVLTAIVTTASGSLNLRADMLPGSRVLTRIPKGTTLTILRQLSAWSQTTYGGYTGYVMNSYLTFLTDTGTTDSDASSAAVVTASGSLNLRESPYGTVVTTIPQNATIQVIQRGSTWCYLLYGGVYGYAMTAYLSFVESTEDTTEAATDDAADAADDTADDTTPATVTATVVTSSGSLNLRETASTSAAILTTIPRLATVTVLVKGDGWCQVEYGVYGGYVQTAFLSFADDSADTEDAAASATVAAWVYTSSGSLNLRASAASSAQVLIAIPRLAQVTLLSQGATWCQVTYGGYTGYAMTAYLTTTKPSELAASDDTDNETSGGTEDSTDEATEDTAEDASTATVEEDPTLAAPDGDLYALITPTNAAATLSLWENCTEQTGWLMDMIANAQVTVVREGDTWCEVVYYGQTGFCLTEGLTLFVQ